jgi:hypothetical protein
MTKRSMLPTAVLGLLVSLAFQTPSHAATYTATVSEAFTVANGTSLSPTIDSITLAFSGLTDGISNLQFVGSAFTNPLAPVTPTLTGNSTAETVTMSFSPGAFTVSGAVMFTTTVSTNVITDLQNQIKLVSETVVAPGETMTFSPLTFSIAVPEPASLVMFLTGMPVPLMVLGMLRRRKVRSKD